MNWNGFSALYLNPANKANAGYPDTDPVNARGAPDLSGCLRVAADAELWLQRHEAAPTPISNALPAPQQRIFLREVYW